MRVSVHESAYECKCVCVSVFVRFNLDAAAAVAVVVSHCFVYSLCLLLT